MAENTDEEHLENPTTIQSENPADEIIPANDTDTINQNQETENMETHAQELHKAPGHGLKHYLFEFLMLFLAVFCGFLAENYRENKVEHQRAQELVASLLEDLQHDTAQLNMLIKYREIKRLNLDSLNILLQSPLETIERNSFYGNLLQPPKFTRLTKHLVQLAN